MFLWWDYNDKSENLKLNIDEFENNIKTCKKAIKPDAQGTQSLSFLSNPFFIIYIYLITGINHSNSKKLYNFENLIKNSFG